MAINTIHPIDATVDKAIDYILNEEKTDNGMLVSTFGCTASGKIASKEFDNIRKLGTGKTTVIAQHLVQSFYPAKLLRNKHIKWVWSFAKSFSEININTYLQLILIKIIFIITLSSTKLIL